MVEISRFIVDLRQKTRKICCLCPSASLFKYKQMSLLLRWVTISPKKALCDLLFEVYKMQAAGNF